MPRSKKPVPKRPIPPDPIYNSYLLARFVNKVMKDGKKTIAQRIVYGALEMIKNQTNEDPVKIFETAIANVAPKMEVRPRRIGGASYQVPMEVRGTRREALATRWLIDAAQARSIKESPNVKSKYPTMAIKLATELIDAYNNTGLAVKHKENTHRVAEANKAFAHFRW